MVETELVADDIVDGRKALDALDAEGAGVRSALWLYVPDAAEWRLILSLPVVDREGPEAGYKLVQKALAKHSVRVPLRRIAVVGTTEPLATRLRKFVRTTPPPGFADIKLRSTVLDGMVIEGAHVYRST